jgi:hypothetical protein
MQSIDSDKKCKFSDSSNMVNGVILLVCQMIGLKMRVNNTPLVEKKEHSNTCSKRGDNVQRQMC